MTRTLVVVDSGRSDTLLATVTDAFGNTIASPSLIWTPRTPCPVTVTLAGIVAGTAPGQCVAVVRVAGTSLSDSTLVVVAPSRGIVVRTTAAFELRAADSTDLSLLVDMYKSNARLGRAAIRMAWDTSVVKHLNSSAGSFSPGTVVINGDSAVAGVLRVAVADPNGALGLLEVLRLRLRTAATAGRAGSISVTVSEMTEARTFTNLVPRTVAVSHPVRTR
jgi:hypothetical protein